MSTTSIPKSQIDAVLKGIRDTLIGILDAQYIFNTVPISPSSEIFLEKANAKAYNTGFTTARAAGFTGTQDEFKIFVDTDTSVTADIRFSLERYTPPRVAHGSLRDINAYIQCFNISN